MKLGTVQNSIKKHLLEVGHLRVVPFKEMQRELISKHLLVEQLANLFMNTTQKIYVRCSSINTLVFNKELSESHLCLLSLFHNQNLKEKS